MLPVIISSMTSWLSQILSIVSNQMTNMQPEQYMIALAVCICVGYVLLRARN